jgi:hypothetical protein
MTQEEALLENLQAVDAQLRESNNFKRARKELRRLLLDDAFVRSNTRRRGEARQEG